MDYLHRAVKDLYMIILQRDIPFGCIRQYSHFLLQAIEMFMYHHDQSIWNILTRKCFRQNVHVNISSQIFVLMVVNYMPWPASQHAI